MSLLPRSSPKSKNMPRSPRQTRLQPTPKQDFFSYHASRQTADTQQAAPRKSANKPKVTRRQWDAQRLPTILALLVLIGSIGYVSTLTTNAKVVVNKASNTASLRPVGVYQQAASEILEDSVLNKSKLSIDTNKISRTMQQQFPELSNVTVVLPMMGHRPIVEVFTLKPALLLSSSKGVYAVSDTGKTMIRTSDVKNVGDMAIPTIRDESDISVELGQGVLSAQDVKFITTIAKQFEAKKLSVSSFTLPRIASELHVRITGQPYYVKFNLLTDARVSAGQYFALKAKLDKDHVTPAEYVDSRVEEKIFYK